MLLLLTTLFAQEANAGWGMSTEAGQATISNVDGDGSIDLNTTLDLWTPKFLVQADVLSLAKSLAVEDRIDFGFNAYYGLGRQRINSDWGGSLQLGTRFDVTQYQLSGQAASDYSIALEPRMGIELRPALVAPAP
ncbi:MAG: hypothetical protein VX278_13610 [Myxococcota bacterium]|nr:hypothetical protein [Myxococcota bacterium]